MVCDRLTSAPKLPCKRLTTYCHQIEAQIQPNRQGRTTKGGNLGCRQMKSALEIVAYANADETEGTIALLEVTIDALRRRGFSDCADLANLVLLRFLDDSISQLANRQSGMSRH